MAEQRSAWACLGLGCLAVGVLGVLVAAGGAFWLYRSAKRLESELHNPEARTAKVLGVLGASELPPGYHALIAFSFPLVMRVAILSDREPGPGGQSHDLGQRGLIYVEMLVLSQNEQALRDYFSGKTTDPGVLRDNKIKIDVDEIIGRGIIERPDVTLMYVAQRGSFSTQGFGGRGISSVILVDCPGDSRMRTAIWFGPDPDPARPAGELSLAGTPADREAIGAFMDHFRFCGASR